MIGEFHKLIVHLTLGHNSARSASDKVREFLLVRGNIGRDSIGTV